MGLLHVLIGTALVAGGGAALNQYLERDADARMRRTADRPLPSARLDARQGLVFGLAVTVAGLAYLFAFSTLLAFVVGAITAAIYVLVYTPLKRVTPWCVAAGAIVGALPPVMGWTAASGTIETGAIALFVIMFVWQLPHFLAIAWIYREEYANARMSVVKLTDVPGTRTTRHIVWLNLFLVPLTLLPALVGIAGTGYTIAAVVLGAAFIVTALRRSTSDMGAYARRVFYASLIYLPVLFIVMAVFRKSS
jgi:protoheme IX farnesyltransferase